MEHLFDVYETTRSKAKDVSLCPVVPGRYIICKDSGDVFYDTKGGVREHLTDIIDLETDAERTAILAPLDKMYFVKETARLWRYLNGAWTDLSAVAAGIKAEPYVRTFTKSEWSNGTITIPRSEHHRELANESILSEVYMLIDGKYSKQCLAAMDTSVSVADDKTIILSYDGAGYGGKVVLIG